MDMKRRGNFCSLAAIALMIHAVGSNGSAGDEPAPLVVPASEFWDGIDGAWSSFYVRVGDPPQAVRVLVSTTAPETAVVLPMGCPNNDSACANSRGGLFNLTK